MVRPAVFAHIKTSAVYCFADPYRKNRFRLEVVLTPKLAQQTAACAETAASNRLNRKYPMARAAIGGLVQRVSFSLIQRDESLPRDIPGKASENLLRLVSAIDAQEHFVKVSERGQVTTSIGSCPRDLQPSFVARRWRNRHL